MQKYYGVKVKITDFLDPDEYRLIQKDVQKLREMDFDDYHIYVHRLSLSWKEKHFNVSGLEARVEKFTLSFNINKKQRISKKIKFVNDLVNDTFPIPKIITPKYDHDKIEYKIPSSYFREEYEFRNYIFILIRKDVRDRHRKVKAVIQAKPAKSYENILEKDKHHVVTKMDCRYRKHIELQRRQYDMNLQHPDSSYEERPTASGQNLRSTLDDLPDKAANVYISLGNVGSMGDGATAKEFEQKKG